MDAYGAALVLANELERENTELRRLFNLLHEKATNYIEWPGFGCDGEDAQPVHAVLEEYRTKFPLDAGAALGDAAARSALGEPGSAPEPAGP